MRVLRKCAAKGDPLGVVALTDGYERRNGRGRTILMQPLGDRLSPPATQWLGAARFPARPQAADMAESHAFRGGTPADLYALNGIDPNPMRLVAAGQCAAIADAVVSRRDPGALGIARPAGPGGIDPKCAAGA